MNKQMTFCTISLISIAFILCLFLSTASADTAESVLPTITETKISTSGHVDNPAIYNNRIVWIDIDYAELETYYDVYM